MKSIIILLLLISCSPYKDATIYTTKVNQPYTIYTQNGILTSNYIEVYLDSYIPRYNASPACVDGGDYTDEYQITDPNGKVLLFPTPVSLILFMEMRGYSYQGTGEYVINNKMFSSWNFRKL